MLRKILRAVATVVVVSVLIGLGALELWYRSLLPKDLPQPSRIAIPGLLRETIWLADFAGEGQPQVRPVYPFLLGPLVVGNRASYSLPTGVARFYLQSPARAREGNLKRLMREAALATWISRHWTADEVLDSYASLVWMGNGRSGVREGSAYLFGKEVEHLNVAEVALLVATIRSPTALSPSCRPERALEARSRVLERMRTAGLVGAGEFQTSSLEPLGVIQSRCSRQP